MPPLYIPKANLSTALLDTSMFMRYRYFPEKLCEHSGNPQIHHTEVTFSELENNLIRQGFPQKAARQMASQALNDFNSYNLPEIPAVMAIAAEVEDCLRQAEIKIETDNDKRDIKRGSQRWIEQLLRKLENNGIGKVGTPIGLTHLLE